MKKNVKSLIGITVGGALLASGATFALWSDSDDVQGGTITSGNLDVETVGTPAWMDVSPDRTDAPHSINLSTFKIVPGDTVEGTFGLDLALEGDNMVAEFDVGGAGATGDLIANTEGVTVTYSVFDDAGDPVTGAQDIALGTTAVVNFASADNPVAGLPTLPATTDGVADYTVVVTAAFDENTPDRVRVQATADLQDLSAGLTQIRTPGAGGGF